MIVSIYPRDKPVNFHLPLLLEPAPHSVPGRLTLALGERRGSSRGKAGWRPGPLAPVSTAEAAWEVWPQLNRAVLLPHTPLEHPALGVALESAGAHLAAKWVYLAGERTSAMRRKVSQISDLSRLSLWWEVSDLTLKGSRKPRGRGLRTVSLAALKYKNINLKIIKKEKKKEKSSPYSH